MNSVDTSTETATASPPVKPGEMRLEVVVLGVSDVDRAKGFYVGLGWRLDADPARPKGSSSRSTTSRRPGPTWSRAASTSASRSTT